MSNPLPGAGLPAPSDDARRHSDVLAGRIREEIRAAGGWIDFARYMELALYAPGLGYYVAGASKLGAGGDFVTAPELSPLFGRALARQAAAWLDGDGAEILELGAGSGTMAADVLDELGAMGRLPRRYAILERSPGLAQRQRGLLEARHPGLRGRIEWLSELPAAFEGVVLANEVLDALPVHIVAWRETGPFERGVAWSDGFAWAERPLRAGGLREAARAIAPGPGYVSEISLQAPALVRSLGACLRRGALIFLDYGFGRREYYHPQRDRGTLMCHYRHYAHDDPFFLPGLQDITAHVDFTAVAEAGVGSGLDLLGYATQARFLVNCGITQLLEAAPAADAAGIATLAGVQKLLSPAEMGELVKVIALGRGVDAPLPGFASGDRSHSL